MCKKQYILQQCVIICIYTSPCMQAQRVVFWTCMSITNGYLINSSCFFVFGWGIGGSIPSGHGDQPLLYICYAMCCVDNAIGSALWYCSLMFFSRFLSLNDCSDYEILGGVFYIHWKCWMEMDATKILIYLYVPFFFSIIQMTFNPYQQVFHLTHFVVSLSFSYILVFVIPSHFS